MKALGYREHDERQRSAERQAEMREMLDKAAPHHGDALTFMGIPVRFEGDEVIATGENRQQRRNNERRLAKVLPSGRLK